MLSWLIWQPVKAQKDLLYAANGIGFNVGAHLAFGTHVQRLGFNLNLFFRQQQFQFNSELRAYYNFKNLGPKLRYTEFVLAQGIVFGYGPPALYNNPFISSVSNQTGYSHTIAYSYNAYFNRIGTTQQTGIVSFGVDNFSLLLENDILARPTLDRFRTGAFLLQYHYRDFFQAGLNCSIWTGEFGRKAEIFLIKAFYNNCYMDTVGGKHTRFSHGILSAQFKYNTGYYGQIVQASAGVDAEQVRNEVQNKFIHNMKFIPASWQKSKNCHLPMLDTEGHVFLYQEGQVIRKPKPYFNFFANPGLFY